ncbi:hypothetical protein KRP22_001599 [Phytophthora ramorum]|nr:hypothetical protein KRP22_880 [Phytophthora ramorum]
MLRRWPQTSRPTALLRHPPSRTFWRQAVEILSRLTSGDADPKTLQSSDTELKRKTPSQWRPQTAVGAEFPLFLQEASFDQVLYGKKLFSDLARHLRSSSDPAQLLQSWNVVKQCQPFVVAKDGVRLFDEAADSKVNALGVLQMLPADVFAQRVAGLNRRSMFVSSTALEGAIGNVTAANEAVVVALLVEYFYALKDCSNTIELFESYNHDRISWLKERSLLETGAVSAVVDDDAPASFGDAEEEKKRSGFVRATRLWAPARSAYLKALTGKNQYHKVVQFAREDKRNLDVACESVRTMSPLLIGCCKEKNSSLARLAIDTMSKRNPGSVIPLSCYEFAVKAAIQKKNRDEGDVDNAMWVARKMRDDAGYILHPELWFALFNTSLHLKREDCALDAFRMYSNNFTALSQDQFRRALRKACRLNHPDVVLTMVRQWLSIVDDKTSSVEAESKTKVLGFVLWEMLSSDHPVSAITQLLAIMASCQIETGGMVLQRTVKMILDDASESLSPPEAIKNSLEFWRTHGSAVQNSVYLMYTLLRQCLERDWLDECELVLKEIADRRLPGVPCNTIVKLMDVNEQRGRFEDNARMCEVLLKSLTGPGFKSLNQQFFERYLKALLCLSRFDEVREQHARLKLGKRFPKSTPIAVALRDAKTQLQ